MSDKLLTPEQRERYRELEHTFDTPGFQYLLRNWREDRDRLYEQTFFAAGNWEEVQEARIRWQLLNELVGLPEQLKMQKEQDLEGAAYESEDTGE